MRAFPTRRETGFATITALAVASLTLTVLAQGGDTPASANVIGSLPFTGTGTTINYANDFDEVCPYTGSTSPDVFYAYSGTGELLEINLCFSGYDTKVYVYDSTLTLIETAMGQSACNDDRCANKGGSFRSYLSCVPADGLIYIGIDGWNGDAGTYLMEVEVMDPIECDLCSIECPPGATIEQDDCAFGDPDPNDQVNGGCLADPPAFSTLACGEEFCGSAYFDGTHGDVEWFDIVNESDCPASFTITGIAEFNARYERVYHDETLDCASAFTFGFEVADACDSFEFQTELVEPGWHVWFVLRPDFTQIVDCNQPAGGPPDEIGDAYVLHVECATKCVCPWDFDESGHVDFQNLLQVLSNWGPCPE